MTGAGAFLPMQRPVDEAARTARIAFLDTVDALATRAAAVEIAHSGMGGGSNLRTWRVIIVEHHFDIDPVPFERLAAMADARLLTALIAMRRRWSLHAVTRAINQPKGQS